MRVVKLRGSLIVRHIPDCRIIVNKSWPWVCPESEYVQPIGHTSRKSMFVFRCNDPNCPAKLGVNPQEVHRLWKMVMAHLRRRGATRRSGRG